MLKFSAAVDRDYRFFHRADKREFRFASDCGCPNLICPMSVNSRDLATHSRPRRNSGSVLGANQIPVVISERDVPGGGWKKVLSSLQQLVRPPLLVVSSSLADDHLWAEVLNLGGHDVLATPFMKRNSAGCLRTRGIGLGTRSGLKRSRRVPQDGEKRGGRKVNTKANNRAQVTATKADVVGLDPLPGDPPADYSIAALAYSYWETRGCQGGSAEEDWLRAEEEVRKRHPQMRIPKEKRAAAKSAAV